MSQNRGNDMLTFQQKTKVLSKLFDAGCVTEKALQTLSMEHILHLKGINISEMIVIMELQKQVKCGKLFSYLGGGNNEQSEPGE